jgi:hypothetical protein
LQGSSWRIFYQPTSRIIDGTILKVSEEFLSAPIISALDLIRHIFLPKCIRCVTNMGGKFSQI